MGETDRWTPSRWRSFSSSCRDPVPGRHGCSAEHLTLDPHSSLPHHFPSLNRPYPPFPPVTLTVLLERTRRVSGRWGRGQGESRFTNDSFLLPAAWDPMPLNLRKMFPNCKNSGGSLCVRPHLGTSTWNVLTCLKTVTVKRPLAGSSLPEQALLRDLRIQVPV